MTSWNGSERSPAENLPNEVLVKILESIGSHELLNSCRLVSKRWNGLASLICRNNRLLLCRTQLGIATLFHAMPFKDATNLPWSSLSIKFCRPSIRTSIGIAQHLGVGLKSLTLSVSPANYRSVIKLLGFMPNLQQFTLCTTSVKFTKPQRYLPVSTDSIVNLPKLKVFTAGFDTLSMSVCLVKAILCNSLYNRLSSFVLQLNDATIYEHDIVALVQVMLKSSINYISLDLFYTGCKLGWNTLGAQTGLDVDTLRVVSTLKNVMPTSDYYRPLELFLHHNSRLTKLSLVGFFTDHLHFAIEVSLLLHIPSLPSLQSLELFFKGGHPSNVDPGQNKSVIHHNPFTSDQFPKLENVSIRCTTLNNWSIDIGKLFGGMKPYDTVKYLNIAHYIGGGGKRWIEVFPNLIDVSVTIHSSEDLIDFIKNMDMLKSVTLILQVGGTHTDVNSVIFGAIQRASEDINHGRFEHLKFLQIRVEYPSDSNRKTILTDLGILPLCILPPLLALTIYTPNTEISENCILQLEVRHHRVLLKKG